MWYAANIVTAFMQIESEDSRTIVEENIILIDASSYEIAIKKAHEFISDDSVSVSYFHPNKSKIVFRGVRRVVAVSNPDLCNDKQPIHGTEITYELLLFKDDIDATAYMNGNYFNASFWRQS